MKKEIVKQVYFYVICAISIVIGMFYLGGGIYGVVKITSPEFTLPQSQWRDIATFQGFKTDWEKNKDTPILTDAELMVRWQDKKQIAIMGEKRGGKQNLLLMLICFIIVMPIFIIHWRLARRLKANGT